MNCDKFINVAVRIRPCNYIYPTSVKVISNKPNPPILFITEKQLSYAFDNIFTVESSQDDVYNELIKPLVDQVLEGYNCTIFAYGQTGTGKTYTMGSNPEDHKAQDVGIIPRVLEDFFSRYNEDKEVELYVSFSEIYNNKVYDLLDGKEDALLVKGFTVQGLSKVRVYNSSNAHRLLEIGGRCRHTGTTKQNRQSSRSHAIFTITYNVKYMNEEVEAKFNLVDLAGSESVRKTGNQGSQFQEGVNINQGLHCIGKVISALSTGAPHVPYRDTKITTILKDSLSRNNFVTLIACISPNMEDTTETIQTLEFAQKAKKIKNKPEINSIIEKFKKEHPSCSITVSSSIIDSSKPKIGSAVKSKTPWKRPYPYNVQITSTAKKPRPTYSVDESTQSLFSHTFSSVSSPQENISPIIRKCVAEVEKTIMKKFDETLMKMKENLSISRANSPVVPLKQLRNEISKIVQNEIRQDKVIKESIVRSSPLEPEVHGVNKVVQRCLDIARKSLQFDTPNGAHIDEYVPLHDVSPILKTPAATTPRRSLRLAKTPLAVNNNIYNLTPSTVNTTGTNIINLINSTKSKYNFNFSSQTVMSQEETKIIEKQNIKSHDELNELQQDCKAFKTPKIIRRSVRLSLLKTKESLQQSPFKLETLSSFKQPSLLKKVLATNKNLDVTNNMIIKNDPDIKSPVPVRRSLRLSILNNKPAETLFNKYYGEDSFIETPAIENPKRRRKHNKTNDPKVKTSAKPKIKSIVPEETFSHDEMRNYVLNILNTGNEKQLQKLATIGPKTANQIYFYRKLNGVFKDITDLKNLPWKESHFNRFLSSNFVTIA